MNIDVSLSSAIFHVHTISANDCGEGKIPESNRTVWDKSGSHLTGRALTQNPPCRYKSDIIK